MPTHFERVSNRSSLIDVDLDLQSTGLGPVITALPTVSRTEPRPIPSGTLARAMATWLSMVFFLTYLLIPAAGTLLGTGTGVLFTSIMTIPAFVMACITTIVAAALARPHIVLDTRTRRDPVIPAALGGFGVWVVVHNTSSLLVPFAVMTSLDLGMLLGGTVVEMVLLGMMFASMTRRPSVALALGGGFQLLLFGLVFSIWSVWI